MPFDFPELGGDFGLRKLGRLGASRANPNQLEPLSPEDEDSLLMGLGRGAMSGVGYVGGTLDKMFGRRALAGLLDTIMSGGESGKREMLSILPFSDTLGITDPAESMGYGDVLRKHGVLGENQKGLDWADAVDFGLDVAGDPGTYFTGGLTGFGKVLTPGGRALKGAGLLDDALKATYDGGKLTKGVRETGLTKTLRDVVGADPAVMDRVNKLAQQGDKSFDVANYLDDPLTSAMGFGLNPLKAPTKNFSPIGDDATMAWAKTLDSAGDTLRYSKPGLQAARMFNHAARNASTPAGQRAASEGTSELRGISGDIGTEHAKAYQDIIDDPAVTSLGLDHNELGDALTSSEALWWEGSHGDISKRFGGADPSAADPAVFRQALSENLKAARPKALPAEIDAATDALISKVHPIIQSRHALRAAKAERGMGVSDSIDRSFAQAHTDRQALDPDGNMLTKGQEGETFQSTLGADTQRKSYLRNVPDVKANKWLGYFAHEMNKAYVAPVVDTLATSKPALWAEVSTALSAHPAWLASASSWMTDWQAKGILRDIETSGVAEAIQRAPTNPNIPDALLYHAMDKVLGVGAADVVRYDGLLKVPVAARSPDDIDFMKLYQSQRDAAEDFLNHARLKTDYIGDAATGGAGKKIFDTDWVANHMRGNQGDAKTLVFTDKMHDLFAESAVVSAAAPPDHVLLTEALRQGGAPEKAGITYAAKKLVEAGKLPPSVLTTINTAPGVLEATPTLEILNNVWVPSKIAADAKGSIEFMNTPEAWEGLFGLFDKFQNFMKTNFTTPFPGFHARNNQTSFVQQLATGSYYPEYGATDLMGRGFTAPYADAKQLFDPKGVIHDVGRFSPDLVGLSDEEGTKILRARFYGHGVSPRYSTKASDSVTALPESRMADEIPGMNEMRKGGILGGIKNYASDMMPQNWPSYNPANVRGVTEAAQQGTVFGPVAAGEKFADVSEATNRAATWLAQLRKGADWNQASEISKLSHVDYSRLTPTERSVMKRLFPFYSYTRQMAEWQLRALAEKPGGLQRQMIRATDQLQEDGGFTPPHVANQTSIAIGDPTADGSQKYLSMDLPHEAPFNLIRPGVSNTDMLMGTIQNVMGQMTPFVKAPIELGTNTQLYSGRKLTDLESSVGRAISNVTGGEPPKLPLVLDEAMQFGPGRYVGEARKLADPRKSLAETILNFTSGVRTSDVDVNKYREIAGREIADKRLAGVSRTFTKTYIPDEELAGLSPDQQQLARLLRTQSIRAQQRARERAQQAPMLGLGQ